MAAQADAALGAAGRGWHVLPLRPGVKLPAFPDHTEDRCNQRDPRCRNGHTGWESRATTDFDRIHRAWRHRSYGVGIATGPSGLVVIDLDVPKPDDQTPEEWRLPGIVDGHDVFATICHQAGEPLPLDTYTVTTPSGGTHLYYQHPDGPQLRNTTGGTTGSLGWKIDTRAHGGYVVAAGTGLAKGRYAVAHDVDPAPLPDWLAERLTPPPLPPQQPVRIELGGDRGGRYLAAAVNGQVDHIRNAPDGTRNTVLYRSAVALGQLAAGGALGTEEVTAVLTRAALDAGLRPREVDRTIASGLKDGAQRPRSVAA
ncbi:bifunctional DNA primase/polymerase [Actinopolymorpha sp. B9G3]|uniref:bifunctional DNA primase/polymerase n=1 Tax=Actinopolymorpha sp. B9G3 TaxID=3158970 RepID=UPI0032D92CA8